MHEAEMFGRTVVSIEDSIRMRAVAGFRVCASWAGSGWERGALESDEYPDEEVLAGFSHSANAGPSRVSGSQMAEANGASAWTGRMS